MKKTGWLIGILVLIGVAAILAANWLRNRADNQPIIARNNSSAEETPDQAIKAETVPDNYINVGGINRPKTDVENPRSSELAKDESAPLPDPGRAQEVDKNANAYTKSVAEAFGKKELAHRLTSMIPPPPFNREEYLKDPEKYLTTVEPGRVFQNLPYGAGVTPLKRTSKYYYEVLQGETVILEAKAAPKMPITYYSNRLGQFSNLLGTITVAADENGIARAEFKVSAGTRDEVEILAASPVHSGQIRYLIKINMLQMSAG